jgi:hypothetical protein
MYVVMQYGLVLSLSLLLLLLLLLLYSPLLGLGRFFSFLILHTDGVVLDGVSARRKAPPYTQKNTNM